MSKLLVIFFVMKLYARINIFRLIRGKLGQEVLKHIRSLEDNKSRLMKIEADISVIKACKEEQLIPTFAKGKLSIKSANRELQYKMAKLVMEAELKDKHNSKKKLENILRRLTFDLKRKVRFILFTAIIHLLNIAIKSRSKATGLRHEKKLKKLRKAQNSTMTDNVNLEFIKHAVHNYSSTIFSEQERITLSFGLEQHIPNRSCKNSIYTEFEQFYQRIFHNIRYLPQDDINRIKTKMRSTCEKYSRINVPCKYRKIVIDLSRNKDIVTMKQDKGRGVVVMNRGK